MISTDVEKYNGILETFSKVYIIRKSSLFKKIIL